MEEILCYCLSCRTGKERDVIGAIKRRYGYKAITPVYQKKEKKQGKWYMKEYTMLPGYIFFYSMRKCDFFSFYFIDDAYKILTYSDGASELNGKDKAFAMWLYQYDGYITTSKVFMKDQRINVIEGPLIGYEGEIIKIDKRKQSALVEFSIGEVTRDIWLSYDLIDEKQREGNANTQQPSMQ